MTRQEFEKCLVAYNEAGNDYRYVLTREQVEYIKSKLPSERKKGNYEGKCGTCKYAMDRTHGNCKSYIECGNPDKKFRNQWTKIKQRTETCKFYERSIQPGGDS